MTKCEQNGHLLGAGTWISVGVPVLTELAATQGFDWLLLDLEHGTMPTDAVITNLMAIGGRDIKTIVRPGGCDRALIARLLDWGANGIMLPHVDDAEQALAVVRAICYPPSGERGFSSSARCFGYGSTLPADMTAWKKPLLMAQIESYSGVINADEIAAVEGIDVLFVGPRDLQFELSSRSGETFSFDEAIKKVAAAATARGKQAGILLGNAADLPRLRGYGYTVFAHGSEISILKEGYKKIIALLK